MLIVHEMTGKYHEMNRPISQWDLDSIIRRKAMFDPSGTWIL